MQKTIIVTCHWLATENSSWQESTKELNDLLNEGWSIKNMIPMGGAGNGSTMMPYLFASLVLLEK